MPSRVRPLRHAGVLSLAVGLSGPLLEAHPWSHHGGGRTEDAAASVSWEDRLALLPTPYRELATDDGGVGCVLARVLAFLDGVEALWSPDDCRCPHHPDALTGSHSPAAVPAEGHDHSTLGTRAWQRPVITPKGRIAAPPVPPPPEV